MPTRFPLQPLLDFTQQRMDTAERTLRQLKQKEETARRRLDELLTFRQEYRDKLAGDAASGMNIHLMRDYHVFLAKVEQAIHHQEAEVEQAHARWQVAHAQWLEQRQKVKAYETLATRHEVREVKRAEKKEQRATDEQASRRAALPRGHE